MFDIFDYIPFIFVIVLLIMFAASAIRVLPEYERGVLFRLGRFAGCGGRAFSSSFPALTN